MKLIELITTYGNGACISIDGYCSEEEYDYLTVPTDYYGNPDEDELSDDNPNHHKPTCLEKEIWWDEVKNRTVKRWNVIGGGIYKVELTIELD